SARTETQPMSTVQRAAAQSLPEQMDAIGRAARAAAELLARTSGETKRAALAAAAREIRAGTAAILRANAEDVAGAKVRGLSSAMIDRLALDVKRIEATAAGVDAIAAFDDPVGSVLAEWQRPNGLRVQRVRVPLGVIGIIY